MEEGGAFNAPFSSAASHLRIIGAIAFITDRGAFNLIHTGLDGKTPALVGLQPDSGR